jgi:hypothetical protein
MTDIIIFKFWQQSSSERVAGKANSVGDIQASPGVGTAPVERKHPSASQICDANALTNRELPTGGQAADLGNPPATSLLS